MSVDQLISAQPGIVPRLEGKHTRDRIMAATVYFDHFSGYSYIHLQCSTDTEDTILSKYAFEQLFLTNDVTVSSYMADNGRFAEKGYRDAIRNSKQTITYCGVGSHHQNGIVERHIGELTSSARTLLLHAKRRWPKAIGTILWPFALKAAEFKHNHLKLNQDGLAPAHLFSGSKYDFELSMHHTWGFPIFVLE